MQPKTELITLDQSAPDVNVNSQSLLKMRDNMSLQPAVLAIQLSYPALAGLSNSVKRSNPAQMEPLLETTSLT